MTDFVKYVVSELKSKRLSKTDALGLIKQFSSRPSHAGAALHPLLHRNTSDLTQQSYTSSFTGDEFFLRDHRIQGKKVLPAVAYLEMTRAAVALALPSQPATSVLEIRNVAWAQPIVHPENSEVLIALFQTADEQVEFEVYSASDTLHCQGNAIFREPATPSPHDLALVTARMTQGRMDGGVLYPSMAQKGIELGPAHQGVKTIYHGIDELLAEIVLPDILDDSRDQYMLHPTMMDSAVQAGMVLVTARLAPGSHAPLPFALEVLRVLASCEKRMFAWVRYAKGSRADDKIIKIDIDLCDADGKLCAQMLGFSSRVRSAEIGVAKPQAGATGCLLAAPRWENAAPSVHATPANIERHIILCDLPALDAASFAGTAAQVIALGTTQESSLDARYTEVALACFEKLQTILKSKPAGKVLLQVVIPNHIEYLAFTGITGMLGSAKQENPKLLGQLLLVNSDTTAAALASLLQQEVCDTPETIVKYDHGQRQLLRWRALEDAQSQNTQLDLKENGVYLITGGLGGLGLLFAKEILAHASATRVVLSGRAKPSAKIQATIDSLNDGGKPRAHYRRIDLSDATHVAQGIAGIVEEFAQLNGILHSAGAIMDQFIIKKSIDEIRQVFEPKVLGTVNLDHATRAIDLDFLVLFSSLVSLFGNPGQADYAAANGFMDGFAAYRNRLVASNSRRGVSVAINWPLWQDGGMVVDAGNRAMLEHSTGMQAMHTENGMQAFYHSLRLGCDQLLVVEGDLAKMQQTLLGAASAPSVVADVSATEAPDVETPSAVAAVAAVAAVTLVANVFEETQDFLRKQFSEVLKLAPQKIDPQAPLERYGIDSILAMELTAQLEITFGSLPKTLFFEHQTIAELAARFVGDFPQKLSSLFSGRDVRPAPSKVSKAAVPAKQSADTGLPAGKRARRRLLTASGPTGSAPVSTDPIAIVGLSGRYPESVDIEAFWQILRDGKDCIIEIPKDRWDWREYYSEDRSKDGCHYSKWGGFISGVDEFDPLFFNIPPAGSELIDPQERLFLQHAWMAVEDAGYTRNSLQIAHKDEQAGQVGVYVGVMYGEYQLFGAEASMQGKRMGIPLSYASVANRVSYILNLHGPSMTLDTMCSSSLTAIHFACHDLRQGRTDLAIAGGVNVTVHPNKYFILSAGQFISGDGHCQSFGVGGDGYIPGEGVGVVILKRLSEAEKEGNHIYGIIKGSALNHGGKTNGYSVPNPKSQSSVIALALQEYGVNARHVSYVEAHGTGTKLGDPIEIAALTQVFRQYTQERQFCAIGSAKSNIGHCESAAGIAGLTKVLLQMKHKMIVPSLHSQVLNPHINFADSPFIVNQTLQPWPQPEIDGKRLPRIAGLSSFGAGGSNAHLIIEEYPVKLPSSQELAEQVVIVLSARTNGQLRRKVDDLLAFIKRQEQPIDLNAMAYTLQVGREAMDMRLALVLDSIGELTDKLAAYSRDEQGIDQCFVGQVEKEKESMSLLSQDDDMMEAVAKWVARKKLLKLAELWVKGLELDWRALNAGQQARLISLPSYPFARDRYWIGDVVKRDATFGARAAVLHPLLHSNTSDFYAQSYTSEFSGTEFFLADHQIGTGGDKQKILPGVAYLEMVRAALDLSLPDHSGNRQLQIRNIAWSQPIIVDGNQRVQITLTPKGENLVDFEVQTENGQDSSLHCQGQIVLSSVTHPSSLDIAALKAQINKGTLPANAIYDAFTAMGIHYGSSFRGVTSVYQGQGQVLAELNLPDSATLNDYVLHPAMLDSALQSALGLADLADLGNQASVPFALDSMVLFAPCSARMFAWVRHSDGAKLADGMSKINIDLCDQDGKLCIQLIGLTSRAIETADARIGVLLACPHWQALANDVATQSPAHHRHQVLLCGLPGLDLIQMQAQLPGVTLKRLAIPASENLAQRYRSAALACFEELQAVFKSAALDKILLQLVITDQAEESLLAGLSGLFATAKLENPNVLGQLVLIESSISASALVAQLRASALRSSEGVLKHVGTTQSALRWQPEPAQAIGKVAFKDGGVYLITGGLGGLGVLFAKEIFQHATDAVVILTGRVDLNGEKQALLEQLSSALPSGRLLYRKLDLSALDQVQALVSRITDEFGGLHGVIHSAGMNRDNYIINKSSAEFAEVLEPKVIGTVNLDLATQQIALDFMLLFSSVSSALGNAGQADYAAANGFMDQFAAYRNRLLKAKARQGKTLAINWPLWQEGGMQIDAETRKLLLQSAGIQPLQTANAMQALYHGLALDAGQVLVLEGDLQRLRRSLQNRHAPVLEPATPSEPASASSDDSNDSSKLLEKTQQYLSAQFSSLLGIPPHEVDAKAPMEKYGMDSVLAMKLTTQLERIFGSLSKTLFFEHQTIASLAGYLLKAFPAIVREKTGVASSVVSNGTRPAALPAVAVGQAPAIRGKLRFAEPLAQRQENQADEVAIIGVGGRYPMAKDLSAFWQNLKSGRDCISEIPEERWDHALLYCPDRNRPGTSYSKWGGFITGIDQFDALFFNISPKEAELIDPQERLFLETVWETIEDAGYSKEAIGQNRVGVYVGAMWGQYELYGVNSNGAGIPSSSFASIANRVSYFFNFQGPSMSLDTMCSSSLTAIHLASEELRKGALDVAIAGGVNVSVHPNKYLALSQGNFASTDGRCRSFGEGGDGYVPGEGVGAVLLKPLQKALQDGDQIYAIIKASTINHGGKTNGYTVPNPLAQSELILEALNKAKIAPSSIAYIETHGTGTSLGDPIEINGLVRAFENAKQQDGLLGKQSCPIGSVKSNIGHLESAAGIAAVTKVLLQLKHQQLVPSLHAERLNPHIDFQSTPFFVQTSLVDWKRIEGQTRRVGISSFGAGGANAHLILEEFVASRELAPLQERPEAFVLSAKNRSSLLAYAERISVFLADAENLSLRDIAFTSQVGRTAMQERLVVIAGSKAALQEKLRQWKQAKSEEQQGKRASVSIEGVYDGNVKDAQASALIDGDAGRAFLQMTLEQRDLAKLAKLWVSGVEIAWGVLHNNQHPHRVSLPTYPFVHERYWIASNTPAQPVAQASKQMLYCRSQWHASEPVSATDQASGPVLFVAACDDDMLAQFARRQAAPVIALTYGDAYQQLAANRYCVKPQSESDFVALIDTLQAQQMMPTRIVFLPTETNQITQQLDLGVFALHYLCKAIQKHKPKDDVKIAVLQRQSSMANAALHLAHAGYLKSLALENPKFTWKLIALEAAFSADEMASYLTAELGDANWNSGEVRYLAQQQGQRQITNRQVREIKPYTPGASGALIKQHGVYIVTGGLGGLGYIFSEYLAKQYNAKLVLTGRSAVNPEQQAKLTALQALTKVIYVQADVSVAEQAASVVGEAKRQFARINGIIHSAGVNRDSFVLNKTKEEMEAVFAAKLMGTINLDQATKEDDLDLFVLFSSIAGAFGNQGQCDYAYANNFLDAFAEKRQALVVAQQRYGKTLSINWPLWEQGGMRISDSDIALIERRTGISPLPTDIGIEFFEACLSAPETQNVTLYGDVAKISAYLSRKSVASTPTVQAASVLDTDATDANLESLCEATENYLKALLSGEIKLPVERIDSQERFEAFGVDSMMINRINGKLESDLGELPKTLFYEYACIEELAAYLVQHAQPALRKCLAHPGAAKIVVKQAAAVSKQFAPVAVVSIASQAAAPVASNASVASSAPVQQPVEKSQEIAIIGVHGQFPRSQSLAQYWQNLKEGRDLIDLVPASRWDCNAFFDADPEQAKAGKIYCKWGGFLDDVDMFDAAFFRVTADDARMLDPQERLFIQSVWAALEDAGYTIDSLKKHYPKAKSADVGVWVGVTTNSYHQLTQQEWDHGNMVNPGSLPWSIANRVSYFFDFLGPSLPIDTACSSALVAIHLACEALKRQECQVAVAGGVNLYLHPSKYLSLCRRRMLALGGKCLSFGDGDDGFIPGEGVGTFILKPLAKAKEDRDFIYGVIKGSAYAHAGRSNGYSAPNPNSQALLVEQALSNAGIDPETISYVEGHGTGTQLGDNLEVASMTQAFRKHTQKKGYCSLGAVKANVGHAESAAGIAGIAKILLQFKHKEIAPSIHAEKINQNIDFDNSPFYLQHKGAPWQVPAGQPRRAMINSFGAGGVNACVILEEYETPVAHAEAGPYLLILSAKKPERLRESAGRLAAHMQAESDIDLARLSYTLQVGREAMDERLALVVDNRGELLDALLAFANNRVSSAVKPILGHLEPHRSKKASKQAEKEQAKALFAGKNFAALAQMWIEGNPLEWGDLYGHQRPNKLPLPCYPFAKERYWVSDGRPGEIARDDVSKPTRLHPLVSHNVSTLRQVSFLSLLSGKQYYGRDHQVNGELFFPGAGFLEIACASGTIAGENSVTRVEDIVWIQPLRLTEGEQQIKTFLKSSGDYAEFAIVSYNDDNEAIVHSEGRLYYESEPVQAQREYSIQEIKRRASKTMAGTDCYRQFQALGFSYGPSFQTIQELHVGDGFALSKLSLCDALREDFEQTILHPAIIDGALQTVIGAAGNAAGGKVTPYLPFAIGAIEILQPLSETCYAYVEPVAGSSANPEMKQFNICLLSESGEVLVKLNNFYVRAL